MIQFQVCVISFVSSNFIFLARAFAMNVKMATHKNMFKILKTAKAKIEWWRIFLVFPEHLPAFVMRSFVLFHEQMLTPCLMCHLTSTKLLKLHTGHGNAKFRVGGKAVGVE